jgi:uncharacterized protein (DUF1499 family)
MMIPAWLSFFDAILAIVLVAVGILGAHFAMILPFRGFQIFLLGFFLSLIGVVLGIVGLFMTRSPQRAAARPRAIFGVLISFVIAVPVLLIIASGLKYPPINDITTDFDNPPEFVHATDLAANHGRDMKYDKARYAERQQAGYGKLEPLKLPAEPDAEFARVEALAKDMPSWRITFDDPKTRTIEGVATSALFRFKDDFVIAVRPGEGGGSLVEMRSKSRDGVGDFGVNYKRIQTFFERLVGTGG